MNGSMSMLNFSLIVNLIVNSSKFGKYCYFNIIEFEKSINSDKILLECIDSNVFVDS